MRGARRKRSGAWLGLDALMLVLFALSVITQYNDPDPVAWILVYGAATLVCALELAGRGGRWLPASVALVSAAWGATIVPTALGYDIRLYDLAIDMQMHSGGVEEAREAIGLFIVAAWSALLAWRAHRRRRARASEEATEPVTTAKADVPLS